METRSGKPFGALRLLAFAATVGSAAANAAVWITHAGNSWPHSELIGRPHHAPIGTVFSPDRAQQQMLSSQYGRFLKGSLDNWRCHTFAG